MSRFLASFYHLLISLAVFLFLAYLVLFVWYPDFFYTIDGGWQGMRIIIGVDLVLGPLLTLIVFKAGKPGLKFDLTIIGLFQAICLTVGLYIVYQERPLFFIYYEEHFYSANKDTFARYNQPVPDPRAFSDSGPAMVVAKVPEDPIEEADFRKQLYQEGVPVWIYPGSYTALGDHMDQVITGGYPIDRIEQRDSRGKLQAFIQEHGGETGDYAFFPIHSRYGSPFIAIRRTDKNFVDILDVAAPLSSG